LAERLRGQLRELGLPDTAEARRRRRRRPWVPRRPPSCWTTFRRAGRDLLPSFGGPAADSGAAGAVLLNQAHCAALNNFILLAFDLSRSPSAGAAAVRLAVRGGRQKQEEMQLVAATCRGCGRALLTAAARAPVCRRRLRRRLPTVRIRDSGAGDVPARVAIGEQLVRLRTPYAGTLTAVSRPRGRRRLRRLQRHGGPAANHQRSLPGGGHGALRSSYARSFRDLLRE
uniref:POP1 domain-containing protein n=1 Tax=Macrostomum lignano TaxID=282301 RepID=A0A1I8F307_9PLAT